ncbi:MAG TPA: tRNA (adenosine(37)-N6)-dimethylallyltransferase MiaA [Pirellulales bacterium]|jgi:tRNA dimethylallyltransferase|nr:tRNA (adenosine(37)-N6)-dimethylallyltransferase MiaA [Pirellulales bacterium]
MSDPLPTNCCYLTGPTAAGKTQAGIDLARLLGGEILSLDSMAVYRRLDLGTAKPTPHERQAAPHHLVDLIEPEDEFSVAQYLAAAHSAVEAIASRGRTPIFVGGTPLYLKGLLRGIFQGPPADWRLRQRLLDEAAEHDPGWLHKQLSRVDPQAADRLHPRDQRRLIRALEVFEKTGRPISDWQQQFDRARPAEDCRVFVLDWPKELLNDRIDRRVEQMFAAGLVAEVEALLAEGRHLGRTAGQAVGYREVLEHLAVQRPLDETIELVKLRTRQFAKRQMTWFRSLSECRWIRLGESDADFDPANIAREIAAQAGGL